MRKQAREQTLSRDAELLEEACQQEGCPLCSTILIAVDRYIESWLYDGFTDETLRAKLSVSRGFCSLHTWQMVQKNSRFQLSLVYQEALQAVLASKGEQSQERARKPWNRLFFWRKGANAAPTPATCHLCQVRDEAEARLVNAMLDLLRAKPERGARVHFCLEHAARVIARAERVAPAMVAHLRAGQQKAKQALLTDIQELLRLYDYRFAHEPQGKERDAWRRAAAFFVGKEGLR